MSNDSMNLNLERLNRLNEKLNNVSKQKYNLLSKNNLFNNNSQIIIKHNKKLLQTTSDNIKNSKYEFLANRTVDLNDRLDEVISQSTNKFNIVKDSVSNMIYNFNKNIIIINID